MDASRIKKHQQIHYNHFKLPANIGASLIIDSNGLVYTGTNNGNVYIFNPEGEVLREIAVSHSVSSLAIGLDESLIVATKDGYLCLLK